MIGTPSNNCSNHGRSCLSVLFACFFFCCYSPVAALQAWQATSNQPEQLVDSTQRLAAEQIEQLIEANQFEDAITQLHSLQQPAARLIENRGLQRAGTQRVQAYIPLEVWRQGKLQQLLSQDGSVRDEHRQKWDAIATTATTSLKQASSMGYASQIERCRENLGRFFATSAGSELALLLVDLHLEKGDALAGLVVLNQHFPALMQCPLSLVNSAATDWHLGWHQVWASLKDQQHDQPLRDQILAAWQSIASRDETLASQVLSRLLMATKLSPDRLDGRSICNWIEVAAGQLADADLRESLQGAVQQSRQWQEIKQQDDKKGYKSIRHGDLSGRPRWQVQLERWINGSDLTPASRPPVGQLQSANPYKPVIYEGRVYLHELNRIRAFDLRSGQAWPKGGSQSVLYETNSSVTTLVPVSHPSVGQPHAGITISQGCLYARMGSPVTAWIHRSRSNDGSSMSYLVGMDLDRQGGMLPGFPLKLRPPTFSDAEFEGAPVVAGRLLIVVVCERDNVGIRRSLVAFDRFSGQLAWRTPAIGRGAVAGAERANVIGSTEPCVAAGMVYYCSDLGAVTCDEVDTGKVVWQAAYQSASNRQAEYPRANRFRYRSGPSCRVSQGRVYCLPQDCPELFALDALTGNLLWSTNEVEVADCSHLVGVCGSSLVLAGDRLVWVDHGSGRPQGAFPSMTTPGTMNSLPQPRGLGNALLAGDLLLYATADSLFVFEGDFKYGETSEAALPNAANARRRSDPHLVDVLPNRYVIEGGNWAWSGSSWLVACPGRLISFSTSP